MRKGRRKENKEVFVVRLGYLLTVDERSEVDHIRYRREKDDEYVEITFRGGHVVAINVTANSCGMILKEVTATVYGM